MNKTYIIGIDPGAKGAIAVFNDYHCHVDSFLDKPIVDCLKDNFQFRSGFVVYIENVHSFPGQGVTSMFNFGKLCGIIEGIVKYQGIEHVYVTPQKWQKKLGLIKEKPEDYKTWTKKQKDAWKRQKKLDALDLAKKLYPDLFDSSDTKELQLSKADAILIMHYGRLENEVKSS